jgi:hypothetical protein
VRRLVVLIGVRQPGGDLDPLNSIGKCLVDMRDWALRQQIPAGDIRIFTDIPELQEPGDPPDLPISDIFEWIDARARAPQPPEQLLVYFSGHGLQIGGATFWLLPQAPEQTHEAIDVVTCVSCAEYSRIRHIVLIGDCCSTVAGNSQFDLVKGATIIKNRSPFERTEQRPVDLLRAASPGNASLEMQVRDAWLSPYTVQLVEALGGVPSSILDTQTAGVPEPLVLRVKKLARTLKSSVSVFMRANGVKSPGDPFDKVVSEEQWISFFPLLPLPPKPPANLPPTLPNVPPLPPNIPPHVPGDALPGTPTTLNVVAAGEEGPVLVKESLATNLDTKLIGVLRHDKAFGTAKLWSSNIPDDYHTQMPCGFLVSGTSVFSVQARPGVEVGMPSEQEVWINPDVVELVLIEFEGGKGTMVPAVPGHIGFLHVEDGRLESLSYEPSGHVAAGEAKRRTQFDERAERIRNVRDTFHEVVTAGDLLFTNIHPRSIMRVLQEVNYGGHVDFSTLLYLAYAAYNSTLARRALPLLSAYMQRQFNFVPFDLKILHDLAGIPDQGAFEFDPPFPMLTYGWSLLNATHLELPERLAELREHYRNASWTNLDPEGVKLCQEYLASLKEGPSARGGNAPPQAEMAFDVETFDSLGLTRPAAEKDDEEKQYFVSE